MRSGREGLHLKDRIDLLRSDLDYAPFTGVGELTRASSQTIHDLKLTVGYVRNTIALYERAVARGQTDEQLASGTDTFVTPIECLVLAWRRGGHAEFIRTRAEWREELAHE